MAAQRSVLIMTVLFALTLVGCVASPSPSNPPAPEGEAQAHPSTPEPPESPSSAQTNAPSPTASAPPSSDPVPEHVEGVTASEGGGSGEVLLRWTQNPRGRRRLVHRVARIDARRDFGANRHSHLGRGNRVRVRALRGSVRDGGLLPRARSGCRRPGEGPKSKEVCGASIGHSC